MYKIFFSGEVGCNYEGQTPVFSAIDAPKEDLAGYLWLKLEDKYLTQWENLCLRRHVKNEGSSLLSSSMWREVLKDSIKNSAGISEIVTRYFNNTEQNMSISVENNGPALTIDVTGLYYRNCNIVERRRYFYADFTLGLHCVHWPQSAQGC